MSNDVPQSFDYALAGQWAAGLGVDRVEELWNAYYTATQKVSTARSRSAVGSFVRHEGDFRTRQDIDVGFRRSDEFDQLSNNIPTTCQSTISMGFDKQPDDVGFYGIQGLSNKSDPLQRGSVLHTVLGQMGNDRFDKVFSFQLPTAPRYKSAGVRFTRETALANFRVWIAYYRTCCFVADEAIQLALELQVSTARGQCPGADRSESFSDPGSAAPSVVSDNCSLAVGDSSQQICAGSDSHVSVDRRIVDDGHSTSDSVGAERVDRVLKSKRVSFDEAAQSSDDGGSDGASSCDRESSIGGVMLSRPSFKSKAVSFILKDNVPLTPDQKKQRLMLLSARRKNKALGLVPKVHSPVFGFSETAKELSAITTAPVDKSLKEFRTTVSEKMRSGLPHPLNAVNKPSRKRSVDSGLSQKFLDWSALRLAAVE